MNDTYVPELPVNASAEIMVGVGLPLEYAHAAEATRMLADLLAEENLALRKRALTEVALLQDRKRALSRLYEDRLHILAGRSGAGEPLPEQWRTDLGQLAKRLGQAVEENARLLKARMAASEMVLNTVAKAVAMASTNEPFYSRNGKIAGGETMSVSINAEI